MDIGNDNGVDAPAGFQALLSNAVNRNVLDRWQLGRESGIQEIQNGIGLIAVTLPVEVMVVGDSAYS